MNSTQEISQSISVVPMVTASSPDISELQRKIGAIEKIIPLIIKELKKPQEEIDEVKKTIDDLRDQIFRSNETISGDMSHLSTMILGLMSGNAGASIQLQDNLQHLNEKVNEIGVKLKDVNTNVGMLLKLNIQHIIKEGKNEK